MISPNKIIGSIVYRTRIALNKNNTFKSNLQGYYYNPNCLVKDEFSLWHYPGTNNEISNALLLISKHPNGSRVKFPAILNFQPIRQEKHENSITIYYNIAIVGSVKREWTTEQRETQVFDKLLRPIYEEFIRQLQSSGYFITGYGLPSHTYYEIFTTGNASGEIIERYGDCIDAIELHNLALQLNTNLCNREIKRIDEENASVTENISKLLNLKQNDRTNKK